MPASMVGLYSSEPSVTIWLAHLFVRRLGGYTRDCLGATQQASELACYLGLACSFS